MFDTDIIDECHVAYIEPKSLVHEVLSFIAAQKIMGILCSGDEGEPDFPEPPGHVLSSHTRRIKNDPSYIQTTIVSREFDLKPNGIDWLFTTNLLRFEVTFEHSKGPIAHCNYVQLTSFGEEVLDDLEKGQEVELYLD